jgi:hypothetical protein
VAQPTLTRPLHAPLPIRERLVAGHHPRQHSAEGPSAAHRMWIVELTAPRSEVLRLSGICAWGSGSHEGLRGRASGSDEDGLLVPTNGVGFWFRQRATRRGFWFRRRATRTGFWFRQRTMRMGFWFRQRATWRGFWFRRREAGCLLQILGSFTEVTSTKKIGKSLKLPVWVITFGDGLYRRALASTRKMSST